MNNFDKVLKGLFLYPKVGKKFVSIVLTIDMKERFKEIFDIDCTFEEFISYLKDDLFVKKIVVDILYEYFGFKRMPILTDSSYEKWYFVKYQDRIANEYSLDYVEKVGR